MSEGITTENLRQAHHLAMLIRDLNADRAFARNHLNNTDADNSQAPCKIFGQVGDPRNFDTWSRIDLKARHNGTRINCNDLGIHPKFTETTNQQIAHFGQFVLREASI